MSLAHADDVGGQQTSSDYGRRVRAGGGVDELLAADGGPRPGAQDLLASIDLLGLSGLLARRAAAARMVEDEGILYGVPATPGGEPRPPPRPSARRWRVDPLPVVLEAAAWQRLAAGLQQRAELLDRLLTDLYGQRLLLRRGVLPPEVVLSHPDFVRQADGVRLPTRRQLFLHTADLARAADGSWQAIADRTQAPSGAGYAIQTRRIVAKVMPGLYRETPLQRLRPFFDVVRSALGEAAPRGGDGAAEVPRVVLLTPGPDSETAFDQAFLATLLGYPLVTGEDLTVRRGRVQMRSLGRLDPVDVVLRRVDADYADPLELRAESQLGVPGLLEADRADQVSVVNGFGAGVLESVGVFAFLPQVARALLGEDLVLGAPQTWWCGQERARRHVLAELDRLVIKSMDRRHGVFGWELSARRREELRRRIEAEPELWCGQEPVPMSTAPVVTGRGLEPRRFTLRTFAVAHQDGYELMAGGLGRVAALADTPLVSNTTGALAKDVWVLAPEPTTGAMPLQVSAGPGEEARPRLHVAAALSPRVAENLFWLGRYAERAEDTVRLVRVVDELGEDWSSRPGTAGATGVAALTEATRRITGTAPRPLVDLVADGELPGSVAYAVQRTVAAAQALREQLSLDTWIVLGSLDRVLEDLADRAAAREDPALAPVLARVLEGLLALAGLGAESMVRDVGWHFMDAGRRIERAQQILVLLRHALDRPRVGSGAEAVMVGADEALVLEAVLIAGESIITHRRRYPGRARAETVLELLLLDRENPRSVALQLDRLAEDLAQLPRTPDAAAVSRDAVPDALRRLTARLRELDPVACAVLEGGGRPQLVEHLDAMVADLHGLAAAMEAAHFIHLAPSRPTPAIVGWTT